MTDERRTLADGSPVTSFHADGFLIASSTLSPEFHRELVAELDHFTLGLDAGHEVLGMVTRAPAIVDDSAVRGALTRALGERYVIDPCRHVHANSHPHPGEWHRDDYCGRAWPSGQFALLCYFPQDTPPELGPTSVMAGSHQRDTLGTGTEVLTAGPAGTFGLMDARLWHRATANVLGRNRYMLKFLFKRTGTVWLAVLALAWAGTASADWVIRGTGPAPTVEVGGAPPAPPPGPPPPVLPPPVVVDNSPFLFPAQCRVNNTDPSARYFPLAVTDGGSFYAGLQEYGNPSPGSHTCAGTIAVGASATYGSDVSGMTLWVPRSALPALIRRILATGRP